MQRPLVALIAISLLSACGGAGNTAEQPANTDTLSVDTFQWEVDQFADVRVLRYQVPGWEQLSLQQKKLAYYLTMAGLSGRDILWDQNYRHNLEVRKALEKILRDYKGERSGADWDNFMLYAKQVFFANGIHHHYGMGKFMPNFPRPYFDSLVAGSGAGIAKETVDILFDSAVDTKKVSLDRDKDVVLASAVNFYGDDVNAKEVAAFYAAREDKNDSTPLSWGLNSKLVRGADGKLMEQT